MALDVIYDVMHYAYVASSTSLVSISDLVSCSMHHKRLPAYMREVKKYHLAHHYKNFELGFGVTSKIWDIVFNTVLPV